jgi:nicotinamide mononucleotide adenylyltransferase
MDNLSTLSLNTTTTNTNISNTINTSTPLNSNSPLTSLDEYQFPIDKLKIKQENESKIPLVIVACGSFSPITYLHLRMFEMAKDYINDQGKYEIIGGYFSPVSDAYGKAGLAKAIHRVHMTKLAVNDNNYINVDPWEALQSTYIRTAKVMQHFDHELNIKRDGIQLENGNFPL